MMISSVVAHAAMLFKNHIPDLNMELLRQNFTVDDAERETFVSSAFDAAQDFVSSYNFASLAKSDDNDSPEALQFSSFACWMNWIKIDIYMPLASCILITTVYMKYIDTPIGI
jgi:hypothetical protein